MLRNVLKLERRTEGNVDTKEMLNTVRELEGFLHWAPDASDPAWMAGIRSIVEFQREDGFFALLEDFWVPSDARVDFIYIPTYLCSAVLMKAYRTDPGLFEGAVGRALARGLDCCTGRGLSGHGYEGLREQIRAVDFFLTAGVMDFLSDHPDMSRKFTEMFDRIGGQFAMMVHKENFRGAWGEDYGEDIRRVDEALHYTVFVYGTLLRGRSNHRGYLRGCPCIGCGILEGFDMYNVGSFPAIVPGEGRVRGELYRVNRRTLERLDMLEGNGSLYVRRRVRVAAEAYTDKSRCGDDGGAAACDAIVYEYLCGVEGLREIPFEQQPYRD